MSQKVILVALAVIAMGLIAEGSPEVAAGAKFEAPPEVADKLIKDGLAEPFKAEQAKPERTVKARVLIDCQLGKCNTVATLPASSAKQAEADGLVDTSTAAVKYAESLAAEQADQA